MSYAHKLSCVQLTITLLITLFYGFTSIELANEQQLTEQALITVLLQSVGAMVLLHIIITAVLAGFNHIEATRGSDEREQLFSLYGDQSAYYAFACYFALLIALLSMDAVTILPISFSGLSASSNILHLLFVGLLFAEILRCARQLFHFFRGY